MNNGALRDDKWLEFQFGKKKCQKSSIVGRGGDDEMGLKRERERERERERTCEEDDKHTFYLSKPASRLN